MIPIDKIENTETCFLQLWLQLDITSQELERNCKRLCIRHILESWFGSQATDDFIWEVCTRCCQNGLDILPAPSLNPRPHREFLRATVSTILKKGMCQIDLHALDTAFSIAYLDSTPLNVNKQRRPP